MELSAREREVLRVIVQAYLDKREPVGSRFVARKSHLGLSAASMRNIMADLAEKDFLDQPHISAGRIPTQKGIRFYLDHFLEPKDLGELERLELKGILEDQELGFFDLLDKVSKWLSVHTGQVSMALGPSKDLARWQQIDFVLLKDDLVMVILIFKGGLMQHKLVKLEKVVKPDDLIKYSNLLNERFAGWPLLKVRHWILKEMQRMQEEFNQLYYQALGLASSVFVRSREREVFVKGRGYVLEQIAPQELQTLRRLLELLDRHSELMELLDKISNAKGVNIDFGNELDGPYLGDWGLISSSYLVQGEPLGLVGTIGPIYMNYARLVPKVDYVAKMLSEVLTKRFLT